MKRADWVNLLSTAVVAASGGLIMVFAGAPTWAVSMTILLLWFIVGRR